MRFLIGAPGARGLLAGIVVIGCSIASAALATTEDWLVDVTAETGLDAHYDNGASGEFYFPEIMGAGVGVLDYDGDGLLDIYLVQGGRIGAGIGPAQRLKGDRLFRNLSARDKDGRWKWRFEDVTDKAGIDARGYGMGVAVADIDNDGDDDLYVLNFGPNQMWRNNGDGSFTDISEFSATADPRWSVSASFADLDGDGILDLYVANYVDFSFDKHKRCRAPGGGETDYCSPSAYSPLADRLYRGLGNGRFEDVSETAGISGQPGPGLGVIADDFNRDGRLDLYVANDGKPNFLWMNQGGMRFVDDAVLAGVAVNADGAAEAGMGVDAADFDRNGEADIFVTHMRNESNTLYVGVGQGWFEDRTARSGLAAGSMAFTGFGTGWFDLDLDGWLDLFVANGAVVREPEARPNERDFPYLQTDQLYLHNRKSGAAAGFVEANDKAGVALTARGVSRGLALADLDNDGRVDIVLANIQGPARILANRAGAGQHWLGLDAVDAKGRRITGVEFKRKVKNGEPVLGRSRGDGSYASAQDPRVVFGLADSVETQTIEVRWPDGQREVFADLAVDQYHRLQRGKGRAE